jgi:hypothetical protein
VKIFPKFSEIKQWTGEEQKAIVRQILPVITPLMIGKWSHAMNFTRALVDFWPVKPPEKISSTFTLELLLSPQKPAKKPAKQPAKQPAKEPAKQPAKQPGA